MSCVCCSSSAHIKVHHCKASVERIIFVNLYNTTKINLLYNTTNIYTMRQKVNLYNKMPIYFKTISYPKYSLRKKQKVTQLIFSLGRLHGRVKSSRSWGNYSYKAVWSSSPFFKKNRISTTGCKPLNLFQKIHKKLK